MEYQSKISRGMDIAARIPVIGSPFWGINYLRTRREAKQLEALHDEWWRDNSRTDECPSWTSSPDYRKLEDEHFIQTVSYIATAGILWGVYIVLR